MAGQSTSLSFTFVMLMVVGLSLVAVYGHVRHNLDNVRLNVIRPALVQ